MNYDQAITFKTNATNSNFPWTTVHFVSPVLSCICATLSQQDAFKNEIRFLGNAENYAQINGLSSVLKGEYQQSKGGGRQGITYSPLTRLRMNHEVDAGNQVIADLLYGQLGENKFVSRLVQVVGELHDNVISHAAGVGYSCTQVYNDGERKRIEFAVADAGRGMLANVKNVKLGIENDLNAIKWCLKKGNTTASSRDDWAQRLPDDAIGSPIPGPVYHADTENHHAGYGLYHLRQLVRLFQGKLWIWSGATQILIERGKMDVLSHFAGNWPGVVVEFEVIVPTRDPLGRPSIITSELEELAKSLGF